MLTAKLRTSLKVMHKKIDITRRKDDVGVASRDVGDVGDVGDDNGPPKGVDVTFDKAQLRHDNGQWEVSTFLDRRCVNKRKHK